MTKFIVLGMATFLFASSISFADNSSITNANNVTQQPPQKTLQLSDNDQSQSWNNNHNNNQNQHHHKHHKHHKHHDNGNNNYNNHNNNVGHN